MKFLVKSLLALNVKRLKVNKHSFDKNEFLSGINEKNLPEENLF